MYEGESQARLDRMRAAAATYEGDLARKDSSVAARISEMGAASTILSGGTRALTMYERFFPKGAVQSANTGSASSLSAGGGNSAWIDAGTDVGDYG